MTHTIGVPKCSNDVVYPYWFEASPPIGVVNKDGKRWPDTEILPDRRFVCAEDLEIETVW